MPKPKPTQGSTHTCQQCGKQWVRYHNLGKPKWCSQRCADLGKYGATRTCQKCHLTYFGVGKKFCSRACSDAVKVSGFGPDIKDAYEADDWDLVLTLLQGWTEPNAAGCWVWMGRFDYYGYPTLRRRNGAMGAHRAALEAGRRARLGGQAAHHMCANITCINPDHLQPVTAAENNAEMLARKSYLVRIRELEAALAEVAPGHPLLGLVPVE